MELKMIRKQLAAVKRLISARNIFLDKGTGSKSYTVYIDDFDSLGISVMDLMSRNETKLHLKNNNITLANDVRKILFDNNFEVAVKPVKTLSTTSYNNYSILRVKNVNSDFSVSYKDAVGISNFPVVFSGGLFSNLIAWEGDNGKGLAKQMAGEGWDVWEIEITGGPETDCSSSEIDTCPNYTYSDLTDFYWPASIAGVQKYSGKNQIDYVGHSNGCRAALSSLNSYSTSGKNNSGYYFNYNTGQYFLVNLSTNPVRKFIGVACPTTLNDVSDISVIARELKGGVSKGDLAIRALYNDKIQHIKRQSYAGRLDAKAWFVARSDYKISTALMKFYNDISIETNTQFAVSPNIANRTYLFAGTEGYFGLKHYEGDGVVPLSDMLMLNNSLDNSVLYLIKENHGGILSNPLFIGTIKEAVK
ncbi:hypothetical protein HYV83_00490 [Candidatus Woesearchaeota archaeon]|nr:hypothetical protein [Candidatus Woesearchaeota archaeon]